MSQPKVSVIIPVYNVEKYIEKCTRTLFGQTLDSLEYIFVDDCSPDNSITVMQRVLEEFPNRKDQVKVICHNQNEGVAKSRQDGIDAASGEYIIHCDPDDWIEGNMYEDMYLKATDTDADIVICDYINEYTNYSETIHHIIPKSQPELFKQITEHIIHTSFWNKLIRNKIAKKTPIETGINLWEDMSVIPIHMMLSNRVVLIDKAFYHYNRQNTESITQTVTKECQISKLNAIISLSKRIKELNLYVSIDRRDLCKLQWNVKRFLLDNPNKEKLILWNNIMPESSKNYKDIGLPFKSIVLSWLASKQMLTPIKIINLIIRKLCNCPIRSFV